MLTETEKAYIAGITDGEGCLSIYLSAKYPRPTLSVGSVDKCLLEYLQNTTKHGCIIHRKSPNPRHKDLWRWTITGNQCIALVRDIRPYLIIKKQQANIILSMDCINQTMLDKLGIK